MFCYEHKFHCITVEASASNMLEKKSGVAKQILDIQPKALATHCHCHSLSLPVKEVTKESKTLSDIMDTSAEIAILVK